MPDTIWLEDPVPAIDPDRWQLTVVDGVGRYELRLGDLLAFDARMRATLDCTSGWYARQDWSGVPVSALLRGSGQARSLLVHSVTGYWIRLPARDVSRLLLATRVGGAPLSAGHGYPLRLVEPQVANAADCRHRRSRYRAGVRVAVSPRARLASSRAKRSGASQNGM
jgi:DMSO/TMAO reductase YedYZ molybdopterin-dependent catalytic subunit